MTAPHMLPSTLLTASAPAIFWLSQLNSPPRRNRCVRFAAAVADSHATLATGRPLQLTRTGLSPARRRQLTGAQAIQTLRRIMINTKHPAATRVSAATALLDRGYGRPLQTVDVNAYHGRFRSVPGSVTSS